MPDPQTPNDMANNTEQIESIIAAVRKEAIWFYNNKYSRNPIHHDIGMAAAVAVEQIEKLIEAEATRARIDETSMWRDKLLPEASKAIYLRIEFDNRIAELKRHHIKEEREEI